MVDLDILKAHGVSAEKLKEKFNRPREDWSEKQQKFIDRVVNRCRAGRDLNLEKHQLFYALDLAWDVAFTQISPTLLTTLCDKSADSADVMEILKTAGKDIREVVQEVPDPKTPGKSMKRVSVPAFFEVTVPLCAAYLKARWAKLTNDRQQFPFFKYDPIISDQATRLKCGVITNRVEEMVVEYGHNETFRQAVFQMLHYAEALQFPVEEWHTEYQWVSESSPYPEAEQDGEEKNHKTIDKVDMKKIVSKEGLRYHLPHPSRTYYDRSYPASTFNTGSGCSFAGHWRTMRFEQIMSRDGYYNLDTIGYSEFWEWFKGVRHNTYWTNVLKGCALNFPGEESNNSVSKNDSERSLANCYSKDLSDRAVVITEHYEWVIPSDWDLGDYDCPVWMRFTMAADYNVIYAAPVGYDPAIIFWGYDTVAGRTHNPSMTLECLWAQDQFNNLISQHLLSVKQNLANISLIDTDIFPEEEIKKIDNLGERMWHKINLFRASFDKLRKRKASGLNAGDPIRDAIISHKFPTANTVELLNAMRTILDTLERIIGVSAQEVGQAASHEQTREEVRHISQNTSVRVTFTDVPIGAAINAWKRQLYNALMSYGQMSFYAQVALEEPISKDDLEKMGFTARTVYDEKNRRQAIQAKDKTAIAYESFVADRDGQDRVDEGESAKLMMQLLEQSLANPMLAPAIGADQALRWMNGIAKFMGFPRDFKLENTGQTQSQQEQVQQALQQMKQYIDQSLQAAQKDTQGALQQILQKNQQQDQTLQQLVQILQGGGGQGGPVPPQPQAPSQFSTVEPASQGDLLQATG